MPVCGPSYSDCVVASGSKPPLSRIATLVGPRLKRRASVMPAAPPPITQTSTSSAVSAGTLRASTNTGGVLAQHDRVLARGAGHATASLPTAVPADAVVQAAARRAEHRW